MNGRTSILDRLARDYANAALPADLRMAAQMSTQKLVTLLEPSFATTAQLLTRTPRFFLSSNVVYALLKMYERTRHDDIYFGRIREIITKRPDLIRPPFLHTGIEMEWPDKTSGEPKLICLYLSDFNRKMSLLPSGLDAFIKHTEQKLGIVPKGEIDYFLEIQRNGLVVADYHQLDDDGVRPNPVKQDDEIRIIISRTGVCHFSFPDSLKDPEKAEAIPDKISAIADLTICALLMLKSRTPLLKITEPEISAFQKQRMKEQLR
jgi:hypothetical protein